MPRTERQLAMLEAMGIRVFGPRAGEASAPSTATATATGTATDTAARSPEARHAGAAAPGRPAPASSTDQTRRGVREPEHDSADDASRAAVTPVRSHASSSAPSARPARPASTLPPHIASLDWPALRDAVASCRACTLCESRKQTVFGVGHAQAHWMIVGEAPGEQEDLKGEPFVGAAGQLLDAMLRALGLTRGEAPPAQQVYIANTLKCRPPRNRNPSPEELAQCEPFLLRQIELVQPRVILAMGRFAVQSLLRTDDAIGRLRGRVHRYDGRPLVVTYHPAYLLRNPIDKARSWEDLCLAAEVAEVAERAARGE